MTGTTGPTTWPAEDAHWIPAVIPGGVHETLLAAGVIEHPYRDEHERTTAWVEDRTWWFRASVKDCPRVWADERLLLEFAGLDGVASIWLDGHLLGTHANQHRPASFDVSELLNAQEHRLLVRFSPPLEVDLSPEQLRERTSTVRQVLARLRPLATPPDEEHLSLRVRRTHRRKAACSWGWDLGPRVVSVGLHGPVTLRRERIGRLAGVHARTTQLLHDWSRATVDVDVDVELWSAAAAEVRVLLRDPQGVVVHEATAPASARCTSSVDLPHPQLWWTHDLGESPLYEVRVELVTEGGIVDSTTRRIGIRTWRLDRSRGPDGPGRVFRFLLNGVPTFSRGGNWVPASLLVGSVGEQQVRALVTAARRAEMTMLRVWGGGIYEQTAFYDACDEQGLAVWQDFMFACDDYPSDDRELTAEVVAEAEHQVRRLRHHACLALWCGNNEVQGIHELTHGNLEPGAWGWDWFHRLLPSVVAEHSPGAEYWPGSPWGEDPDELVNGVRDGDRHAWEVWHGVDVGAGDSEMYPTRGQAVHFRRYEKDHGRFISEFGIHAAPDLRTLRRWVDPARLDLHSPSFAHRNKDTPADKGWALMREETGEPTTLEQYVDFSMACQAEGLKLGVEHYRRRQPHCGGTLVWQFNDVWPGLSWSVLDHDLRPKASYWFLRSAYRRVLASFRCHGGVLELWLTNSAREAVRVDLEISLGSVAGGPAAERTAVRHTAAPYSSVPLWSTAAPAADQVAWVVDHTGHAAENRRFFAPLKDLPLEGTVTGRFRRTGPSSGALSLTSSGYGYLTRVVVDDAAVLLSADYLDIRDGTTRTVHLTGLSEGFDPAQLSVASYGRPASPVEVL